MGGNRRTGRWSNLQRHPVLAENLAADIFPRDQQLGEWDRFEEGARIVLWIRGRLRLRQDF